MVLCGDLNGTEIQKREDTGIHKYGIAGLPKWLSGKESTCQAGDVGLIPGLEESLEKEMATHSSILAYEISWAEESGQLQSMKLQKNQIQLSD